MDSAAVGGFSIAAALVLLALRVPVAVALGLSGVIGYLTISSSPYGVWYTLGTTILQVGTEYTFSVIPLFVLMGSLAVQSGMTDRLFTASTALFGRARGAEAMATIAASAALGAVSGSSLATTATMSRVAGNDLLRRGYAQSLVGGAIAAGGTLGILIPPSIVIIIYALITGQSVAYLFAAGLVPGILLTLFYVAATYISIRLRPHSAPTPVSTMKHRMR
ncbi:MAG: TRAP transporter large permease subunit, partial [Pseudomonadota bacterium]